MIEFAFILPLFLFLLFGVVSFSIALYNKTVLTMAAREGARAGALYDPNGNSAATRARSAAMQVCQNNLISFGGSMNPAVTSTTSGAGGPGDILTVTANMNYSGMFIFWDYSDFLISAATSMRIE
ncbi:TadE/TadG family type IV pilus assembly protein [Prosthecochloris ethylica]|uniref:TadE/TadG family type IV pilus assembly protein n=1 Tax=Prosthecochloris ethylica TaxID=2743976 RepID=UPI001F5B11A5|nr:TadE/TadG family type IV pilus assembly protein [Prosthecochloris ethylica]